MRRKMICFIVEDITHMILRLFLFTGAHDTVLDHADDLFSFTLRNDDVQYFDRRWDEIRLSMRLKTVLEFFDLEIHQKISKPYYQILSTMVRRSLDQKLRSRNFDDRNERIETGAAVANRTGPRGVTNTERWKCVEKRNLRGSTFLAPRRLWD